MADLTLLLEQILQTLESRRLEISSSEGCRLEFVEEISASRECTMELQIRIAVRPRAADSVAEDEPREEFERRLYNTLALHYADHNLNAERLARLLFMSQSTLYRRVQELANTSPMRLLRDYRLRHARSLLLAGNLSVADVAELSGFGSRIYFSSCFREKYRQAPSDYAENVASSELAEPVEGKEALVDATRIPE